MDVNNTERLTLLGQQEQEFLSGELDRLLFQNHSYRCLTASVAVTVLRSIMEEKVFDDNQETLEEVEMMDSVKQIRAIIRRDAADTESTSDDEEQHNLNDERKTAIIKFISAKIVSELTDKMLDSRKPTPKIYPTVDPASTEQTSRVLPPVPSTSTGTGQTKLPPIPSALLKTTPPPVDKEKIRKNQMQFWDKPCIIIVGDSGTGKSSLINAIFGTEEKIGVGKPVTQEISVIEQESLILIDSKGFEKESEGDDAMKKLTEFLESRTFKTKIHMVWYVIAADSTRVQEGIREICNRYFKDLPTFFLLSKCDRVSPKNLKIMKDAVLDLKLSSFAGVYGLSVRPPVALEYPRICPSCPTTHVEPIFNADAVPQNIYCGNCKGSYNACMNCESSKLLLDTSEQSWFCKSCKEEWPQLTSPESEFDELIKATYNQFADINEAYAAKFKQGLLLRHLKIFATTTATAVTAGLSGAVVGGLFGGIIGAAVGLASATVAGAKLGMKVSERYDDPYDMLKTYVPPSETDNECDGTEQQNEDETAVEEGDEETDASDLKTTYSEADAKDELTKLISSQITLSSDEANEYL